MGLFGKIKNIFYDEEVIEVPEEEETQNIRVETSKPKIEEITPAQTRKSIDEEETPRRSSIKTTIESEREIFKPEPTFRFPILDEEEPKEEPKIKTRSSVLNFVDYENKKAKKVESQRETKVDDVAKPFKPSPVISPIYGILDKNYKKDEIVEKKDSSVTYRPKKSEMNYDYVRRKAYGTLEDELENTLSRINSGEEEIEEVITEKEKSIEDLLSEINDNANVSVGEMEERVKDQIEKEKEEYTSDFEQTEEEVEEIDEDVTPKKRTIEDIGDKTLEHDLFNLIDSMYEDKEEE